MRARRRLIAIVVVAIGIAGSGAAADGGTVALEPLGGGLFAAPVEIGGAVLRMLLDTGATCSLVRSEVAEGLDLTPRARYSFASAAGAAEAAWAGPVAARLGGAELRIDCLGWSAGLDEDVLGPGVDGVLGADALMDLPVLIDPWRERLVLGPEALAVSGRVVPLTLIAGRPAVSLERPRRGAAGGGPLRLVLDSAAEDLVLFGAAAARMGPAGRVRLRTLAGERGVPVAAAPELDGLCRKPRRAVLLPDVDREEDGLLPLAAAGAVAFDWERGVAIFGASPDPGPPSRDLAFGW